MATGPLSGKVALVTGAGSSIGMGRAMALALIQRIPPIVEAGRPLCPLCRQPLEGDGGHFCPGSNGHSDQPLPEAFSADQQPEDR